jgi:hypothetical protein
MFGWLAFVWLVLMELGHLLLPAVGLRKQKLKLYTGNYKQRRKYARMWFPGPE